MPQGRIDKIIKEYNQYLDDLIKDLASKGIYVNRESMAYGYTLDLNNLGLKKIPKLPPHIMSIDLSDNPISKIENLSPGVNMLRLNGTKISKIENLPPNLTDLDLSDNPISKIENLPINLKMLYLNSTNISKIENLPINLTYLDLSYTNISKIENLPPTLEKLYLNSTNISKIGNLPPKLKELYLSNTPYYKSLAFSKPEFKTFIFNNKEYKYHTIKKGTLLFRRTHTVKKINESLVGFRNGDNYLYPPNHRIYCTMKPTYDNNQYAYIYGNIQTIWELKEDINLLINQYNYPEEIQTTCNTIDVRDEGNCISSYLQEKYKIRGVFADKNDDKNIIDILKGEHQHPYISQNISFYPFKKLENKDILTPVSKYDLNWLVKHLDDYVAEPIIIMTDSASVLKSLYSSKGYKHIDGITYKIDERKDGSLIFIKN